MINDNYINITYKEKIIISKKFDENDKKIKVLDEKVSVNNTLIDNNFRSILPLKRNYVIQSYRPRMCETISRVIEMLTI